jgi:HTH-type transcriptional regulator / antitoxin HigA
MEIRPIRTEADYRAALDAVATLERAEPGSEEFDRLDVLLTLIERYEATVSPIAPPDPVDAILFAMDRLGLSRHDLEAHIGGSGRVSEILNRERRLTLAMIRRLSVALKIPAEILVQEYPLRYRQAA